MICCNPRTRFGSESRTSATSPSVTTFPLGEQRSSRSLMIAPKLSAVPNDNNPSASTQTATCNSLITYDSTSKFSAKFAKQ